MILINVGANGVTTPYWPIYYQTGLLFCSIQPIISTIMAMTKTDVRKYTYQLLTLSDIFNNSRSSTNV